MQHSISLQEAIDMTSLYRSKRETILGSEYQGKNVLTLSETFDKPDIEEVLQRTGCVGLRIYYGMDENTKIHAIIVGVNASNEDILPSSTSESTDEVYLLERGIRCPDLCPPPSPLTD